MIVNDRKGPSLAAISNASNLFHFSGTGEAMQPLPQLACIKLAVLGEHQVDPSRVLARKGPGRFTVSS